MSDEEPKEQDELAKEGDAAWRERTQEVGADEDLGGAPPPAGIDPADNHP